MRCFPASPGSPHCLLMSLRIGFRAGATWMLLILSLGWSIVSGAAEASSAKTLEDLAPSYSANVIKLHVSSPEVSQMVMRCLGHCSLLQPLQDMAATVSLPPSEIRGFIFVQDRRGKRGSFLCQFSSAETLSRLWNQLQPKLMGGSEQLYRLNTQTEELEDLYCAILSPDIIAFYQFSNPKQIHLDCKGLPANLRTELNKHPEAWLQNTGDFVWSRDLQKIMEDYQINVSYSTKNKKSQLLGEFHSDNPWHTAATMVMIRSFLVMVFSEIGHLQPEETALIMQDFQFTPKQNTLHLRIDDLEKTLEKSSKLVLPEQLRQAL